jgi:hypothetical protein
MNQQLLEEFVEYEGTKSSQSGGMTISSDGRLYLGLLNQLAVGQGDLNTTNSGGGSSTSVAESITALAQDDDLLEWVDCFGFSNGVDEDGEGAGYLWFSVNRLNRFLAGQVDSERVNYRIERIKIDAGSYMEP